jgi:hypothetical protein
MTLFTKPTPVTSPKTIELIIYIASKLKDKPNYGSTLLGKALCLIDSMSYLKKGEPITELSYIKQERGPTPHPGKFLPVRDALVSSGELERIDTSYFGRTQNKYVAKREPKIDVFDKEEIFLIDDVLESICDHNASEISDYTHQFISWIVANHKEELPFYTFLITSKEPELRDYEWADKALKLYKSKIKDAS